MVNEMGTKKVGSGGLRWHRFILAVLICAFLWNVQYIYSLLEPKKEISPHPVYERRRILKTVNPSPGSENTAPLENDIQQPEYDRDEPAALVSTANISSDLSLDAIGRAKSDQCRRQLIDVAFVRENHPEMINALTLPRNCPLAETANYRRYVGCYADHPKDRLLRRGEYILKETNSVDNCLNYCIRAGQELAGVQYGSECFCGSSRSLQKTDRLSDDQGPCQAYSCPGNQSEFCGGYKLMTVYETGVGKKAPIAVKHVENDEIIDGPASIKIVFLLQLNGRSVRQIRRMLKLIYRRKHFYYIHIDARQPYMHREMLKLERLLPNVKLKRNRFSPIWGGASLLSMMLDSFKDLLDEFRFWPWEYVINLSECDMPLVSVDSLERLLRKYDGTNFLRSHGTNTASFIRKQGLDQVFSECDNRMYRLGSRRLPNGIRMDGGSDWFILPRTFIEYTIHTTDTLAVGLRKLFETVLLPAEAYFHTLAMNSDFCTKMAETNMRLINWRRKQGCKCQYKHIVDWCGCSPNVLKMDDWDRLEHPAVFQRLDYFGRKFDPMIDQTVIRRVEAQIHQQEESMAEIVADAARADAASNPFFNYTSTSMPEFTGLPYWSMEDMPGLHSYWENQYDILDQSTDQLRQRDYSNWLLFRSLVRLAVKRVFSSPDQKECEKRCGVDTVERIHVYQEVDLFQGLLVQFNGTCFGGTSGKGNYSWSVEAFVKRLVNTSKYIDADPLVKALLALEVGTKFDVKEEIFRNYIGSMAVDGEIAVRHQWDLSVLKDIDSDPRKVEVMFLDPHGINRGTYVQRLDNPTGVEYFKLPVTKEDELEPGIWKLQLHTDGHSLLAETSFLLLPSDNGQLKENESYIDDLVSRFYRVDDLCRAPTPNYSPNKDVGNCEKLFVITASEQETHGHIIDEKTMKKDNAKIDICKNVFWSSLSPDPKSEISGFDWKRGLIFPR